MRQYAAGLQSLVHAEEALACEGNNQHSTLQHDLLCLRGSLYLGLADLDNAKRAFEQSLEIDPSSSEACAGLGEVFHLAGLDDHARTMFEWVLQNDPEDQRVQQKLQALSHTRGTAEHQIILQSPSMPADVTAVP
jgi:Tfp pilus assembly protein PilF